MFSDNDNTFLMKHRGKILMVALFTIIGILFMTIGILKTVFVIFLAGVGLLVGYVLDDKELVRRFLNTYLGK